MTEDRLVHGLVGLVLVGIYLSVRRLPFRAGGLVLVVAMALLGTWVPDWDLVLGIGYHRSPLTHSALPALLVGWAAWRLGTAGAFVGFSIGLGSHLAWDIVDYGDVRWIPGGANDRLFLLVNVAVLLAMAMRVDARGWPGRRVAARRRRH